MEKDCPFCLNNLTSEILLENNFSYAIYDKFPVSKGHILIIPKQHNSNYFDLSLEEQKECLILLNNAKKIIDKEFKPDGYNIGININKDAGQTIWHAHIHLIPRYGGDVEEPRGGVRGVIPSKRNY
jgi:diadenosine tetraphosphate (Ap4A) HIT family hydrolase